jgi:hypothetical protein
MTSTKIGTLIRQELDRFIQTELGIALNEYIKKIAREEFDTILSNSAAREMLHKQVVDLSVDMAKRLVEREAWENRAEFAVRNHFDHTVSAIVDKLEPMLTHAAERELEDRIFEAVGNKLERMLKKE